MGELVKKIGVINVGGADFDVELNQPNVGSEDNIIHIQNEKVRIECDETIFLGLATSILVAKENFQYYKNMNRDIQ